MDDDVILDKQYNRTASWDNKKDTWNVRDQCQYRWLYPDGITEASPWFNEIEDALDWIKTYDKEMKRQTQKII